MATNAVQALREGRSETLFQTAEPYLKGNHRIALRAAIVRELVGPISNARILDLGCGNGAVSLPLAPGNSLTLVDCSRAMIDAARKVPGVDYVVGDLLRYRETGFDLTLCIGVLAHVSDSAAVIASVARSLRPGGRCVIQFSPSERPINRLNHWLKRSPYHRTHTRHVMRHAEKNGLYPVAERSHLLVLPGMIHLLGPLLAPYDRWIQRTRLERHATDTLVLFEKR